MKLNELLRIVWINIIQNKFKVVLTSIGLVVGTATIVMVIAIGLGGQKDVAEQFKNLNACAIDISYEIADDTGSGGKSGFSDFSSFGSMPGMNMQGGNSSSGKGTMPGSDKSSSNSSSTNSSSSDNSSSDRGNKQGMGGPSMPGGGSGIIMGGNGSDSSDRMNKDVITLTEDDVDDIEVFVPNISSTTICYTTKTNVEGGELEEATSYSIGAVKSNYADISNLEMTIGDFITSSNEENKEKVCILGASVAKEIFGSAVEAYDSIIYIDSRPYVVNGVIEAMGSVSSGISPDETIFIPYSTGVKYISGTNISPTITVLADDVDNIQTVSENIQSVLSETYPNAEFTIEDAGSKMEAASSANDTLTTLLVAMAIIVFIVGGIGIMNVLFVSIKERTNEIGILKALGCSKKDILVEFLFEAVAISIIGGIIGVVLSLGITPIIEQLNVRVELSVLGGIIAMVFALFTGTVFGFYPAWKASRLVPIEALNQE